MAEGVTKSKDDIDADEKQVKWEEIKNKFKSGQTAWIQTYCKDELLAICSRYEVELPTGAKLDSVRKLLIEAVRSRGGKGSVKRVTDGVGQQEPKMAKFNANTIEPFNKGAKWKTFKDQLEAFIIRNDVTEAKKSVLPIARLNA